MKNLYYHRHIGDLKKRLKEHVSLDQLRALHKVKPLWHFLIAGRHLLLFLACGWVLYAFENPWIWVPVACIQGFNILGFIILLHEHVHSLIFVRKHPAWMRLLGLFYALPSAISATQFDVWHNDHHRELGSIDDDPKRAHLTPKIIRRWYKLLYFTPALFVIYAIAAGREARTYPPEAQRRIMLERIGNIVVHLAVVMGLASLGGDVLLRVYVVPFFLCFPPAFMLNRLGQHYDVNPEDPAGWATLVNGNPLWRLLFLHSNHHIEHHYYPGVPFYHLPRLNRLLRPFFAANHIENHTYTRLLIGWLLQNHEPHTDWTTEDSPREEDPVLPARARS